MSDAGRRLMSLRSDPGQTQLDALPPPAPLAEGEVVLGLDRFSLTTNNITYAAYGDAIGYWTVFPTGVDGWGLMPVWGFADVLESRAEGVAVGARVFGYFPMANTLRVQAEKISRGGFADASPGGNRCRTSTTATSCAPPTPTTTRRWRTAKPCSAPCS